MYLSADDYIFLGSVLKMQFSSCTTKNTILWNSHLVMPLYEGHSGIQYMQFAKINLNACCELRCDVHYNGDILIALIMPHF